MRSGAKTSISFAELATLGKDNSADWSIVVTHAQRLSKDLCRWTCLVLIDWLPSGMEHTLDATPLASTEQFLGVR
ncbi:hypothetical protein CRM22_007454 [Opisthorchis felineus]|uniref:Uncharacterized protein n=1 Tax=Opisthorchis felineus TaxID=147828 RepID=A0A4S2LMQ5_OPIFE|nr:hypothetical protein CRM22_007454 [Opisthorchis felineus]